MRFLWISGGIQAIRVNVCMPPLELVTMVNTQLVALLCNTSAEFEVLESSIVIATHSRRMPPPPLPAGPIPPFNSIDLSVGVDLTNSTTPDQKTVQWDDWKEEHSIELFELQLRFDGFIMGKCFRSSMPTIAETKN